MDDRLKKLLIKDGQCQLLIKELEWLLDHPDFWDPDIKEEYKHSMLYLAEYDKKDWTRYLKRRLNFYEKELENINDQMNKFKYFEK
jgi:hypothetical protein